MGDRENLFYKLLIFRSRGIGAVKYHELIRDSGSAEAAVESLHVSGELMDSVKREIELAESIGVKYLTDDSDLFPEIYKSVRNHAPIISVRGNINTLKKKTVGIVGTRHASAAGIKFTSTLAHEFSSNGFAVVSGMAMGTDTAAHSGALLNSGDSETIAVLAGGVDYIWPSENEKLYREILMRGAVISDMPVGFVPVASNFIARNRIVAGISERLILGEADEKSGSVTTANFALEYGRQLWAIPGHPSDERSVGPNRFIANGLAKLCGGSNDFFANNVSDDHKKHQTSNKEILSNELLDLIGSIPVSEDVLTNIVKKNISQISSELVVLELNGLIKKTAFGYVRV